VRQPTRLVQQPLPGRILLVGVVLAGGGLDLGRRIPST
jgi:hypothetical protein